MNDTQKPVVKVCLHGNCQAKGSDEIYDKLRAELHDEALVLPTQGCLDHCETGPCVSVTGNILDHVTLEDSTKRVREELKHPSLKSDGAGTRSLEDLESVLDDILPS